jgi:glycosyltransferase involved in cell wall biosynthesis
LPVIVAEGDGTQRDLVTGGNGWLIKPNSLEELNQAMRKALSDPDRLRHMGEASYKIVVERANIEAMAEVFRNVMNSLIKGSR